MDSTDFSSNNEHQIGLVKPSNQKSEHCKKKQKKQSRIHAKFICNCIIIHAKLEFLKRYSSISPFLPGEPNEQSNTITARNGGRAFVVLRQPDNQTTITDNTQHIAFIAYNKYYHGNWLLCVQITSGGQARQRFAWYG